MSSHQSKGGTCSLLSTSPKAASTRKFGENNVNWYSSNKHKFAPLQHINTSCSPTHPRGHHNIRPTYYLHNPWISILIIYLNNLYWTSLLGEKIGLIKERAFLCQPRSLMDATHHHHHHLPAALTSLTPPRVSPPCPHPASPWHFVWSPRHQTPHSTGSAHWQVDKFTALKSTTPHSQTTLSATVRMVTWSWLEVPRTVFFPLGLIKMSPEIVNLFLLLSWVHHVSRSVREAFTDHPWRDKNAWQSRHEFIMQFRSSFPCVATERLNKVANETVWVRSSHSEAWIDSTHGVPPVSYTLSRVFPLLLCHYQHAIRKRVCGCSGSSDALLGWPRGDHFIPPHDVIWRFI